jgi:hypothetical protein
LLCAEELPVVEAAVVVVAAPLDPGVTATEVVAGVVPFKQVVVPKLYKKLKSIKGKHHIPF